MSSHWLPGAILLTALASAAWPAQRVQVKPYLGSPTIFLDDKPTSPLMFFGWAGGGGPTTLHLTTEWQQFAITVTAPETTDGDAGIHFRVGGGGPGTVWVDDVRVYPGPKADNPPTNFVRQGDFEGTRDEVSRAWSFFQADYASAKATWELDPQVKVSGRQGLRIDIENAGENTMHLHWYQKGYRVTQGQQYTYSLWMKADKPRTADFMMLHIPEPWTVYGSSEPPYVQQVKKAAAANVHIHSFGIPLPWPKPGEQPSFTGVDAAIDMTLRADPQALLLPRFGMEPPGWWSEQHPGDRMLFDDGKTQSISMASESWRLEMQQHLRALVRHCEEKYGDHMLGYHPCGQHTGEWFYERSWEPRLSDFSPAMQLGFRNWLQRRYVTDAALQQAWHDPQATLATATIPPAERHLRTTLGFFRDPQTERPVIDYYFYKQVAMVEPLELMLRVIKDETKGRRLTCLFYGYLFDMHGLPTGPQTSGHLAMSRLLRSSDLDIVCSPISYADREQGGAGCFMSAVDSVRAAGKLWLNEDDTRTYLTPKDEPYSRVDTLQGTQWVHRRNFSQLWPRRLATWYMDLPGVGWLNSKELWDNLGGLQHFYLQHLDEPAQWAPEVAVILDEDSAPYTANTRNLHSPLVYQMRSQFYRLGAPFSFYLLSDLVAGKVPPAKAYLFPNCFHLGAAQRRRVLQATAGKTAVWFYGGGFLADRAEDANLEQVIGLKLQRGTAQPGKVTPDTTQALAAGLEPFGTDTVLDPLWTVSEPEAQVLGRYADGTAAVAAKQTAEGLRVYVGALHCPARLLRGVLRQSGVHLYEDADDVVLTDGRFFSLTATSAGEKLVRFPRPVTVTEAIEGTPVARQVQELKLTLEKGETRLYLLQ